MPLLTLDFEAKTKTEAMLLEEGAKDEKWPLVCDGRIKAADADPIGPAVYKGTPDSKDGPVTRALFLFSDTDDAVVCVVDNADEMDLTLTIANFLDSYGASTSAMKAKRPVIDAGSGSGSGSGSGGGE
ncbi:hypothetical protein SAMN02746065_107160 [Desulfocicer vacuolatum DSM 3385]|uniref:Uncharacterized protein n=1 Tax=Desulfocicer vacuolatum DSM 3385 TaxID=1121400 RepID=A0A1W2B9D0_9BACT|nr:hypothetical protein [Desulfocicer vacuolatum]SMC69529.1 hypothetical protein SAMN02746065_107160 [Desulfocicer vacuolatum DSM 3385]